MTTEITTTVIETETVIVEQPDPIEQPGPSVQPDGVTRAFMAVWALFMLMMVFAIKLSEEA